IFFKMSNRSKGILHFLTLRRGNHQYSEELARNSVPNPKKKNCKNLSNGKKKPKKKSFSFRNFLNPKCPFDGSSSEESLSQTATFTRIRKTLTKIQYF